MKENEGWLFEVVAFHNFQGENVCYIFFNLYFVTVLVHLVVHWKIFCNKINSRLKASFLMIGLLT